MTPRRVRRPVISCGISRRSGGSPLTGRCSPFGLTHAHYLVLGSLSEFSRSGAQPSQRELADFAGLEVMYVSKLVRGLERSGLLRRADHPDDPRAFQLELTARGADLVVQAATVMRKLFDQPIEPDRRTHRNTTCRTDADA